jgi:transcriptional regulator with XRE-family HTH domain
LTSLSEYGTILLQVNGEPRRANVQLSRLRDLREKRGMSQQDLSERSGVSRDGISHYENGTREARPSTARKLAEALEVEVQDLMDTAQKVEVTVGSLDQNGVFEGEILRFTGQLVDAYEDGGYKYELFECPDGYRVHVDEGEGIDSALYPSPVKDPYTEELEYPLFDAEEVAERWRAFGNTVGKIRVRDID